MGDTLTGSGYRRIDISFDSEILGVAVESAETSLRSGTPPCRKTGRGAEKYRLEAAEIRKAVEIVRDESFQDQLRSIADQYEALATMIEVEHERQRAQTAASSSTLRSQERPRDPDGRGLPGQQKPDQGNDRPKYYGEGEGDESPRRIRRSVDRDLEHLRDSQQYACPTSACCRAIGLWRADASERLEQCALTPQFEIYCKPPVRELPAVDRGAGPGICLDNHVRWVLRGGGKRSARSESQP